jgi:hypothetical protein
VKGRIPKKYSCSKSEGVTVNCTELCVISASVKLKVISFVLFLQEKTKNNNDIAASIKVIFLIINIKGSGLLTHRKAGEPH